MFDFLRLFADGLALLPFLADAVDNVVKHGSRPEVMIFGGVVALLVGVFAMLYFVASAPAEKARQLAQQNEQIERTANNPGPIRRYPATDDGFLPAAVSALGEPLYVHRYESVAEQCHLGWLFGSSADKHPTYISYEEAIVVVTPDAYTVIPWEEVTEFLHTVGFGASNGQKFTIGPDFTNYGPLYERFESEIMAHVFPKALAAVAEGKQWVFPPFGEATTGSALIAAFGRPQLFAPLTISKQGIRYKDQNLAWSDVGSIQLIRHLHNGALCSTTISIRKNWQLFACMQFDFHSVANSFLLTELLPHVCPAHLLVPAGSQGAN